MKPLNNVTNSDVHHKASSIRLLALDVDGILSDGKIIYDASGVETKAFYVQDGVGIKAVQKYGITVAIITGRSSPMVEKRAKELGIEYIVQGQDDKITALNEIAKLKGLDVSQCAYMGDDLPDIKALQQAGLACSVPNAHHEVLSRVDYVTQQYGGCGAVREVCDLLLSAQNNYQAFIADYIEGHTY